MIKAYKYRLYPTKEQKQLLERHFGCCRWAYNYGLEKKISAWTEHKKRLSRFDIQASMVKLKHKKATAWLQEVNSQALCASLLNLDTAYNSFFKQHKGFPKFKSKHNSRQSFQVPQNTCIEWNKSKLDIPKFSPISIQLHRNFKGTIKTVTISKTSANKYYASVLVETLDVPKKPKAIKPSATLGIDLGIHSFITTSKGEHISNPAFFKHTEHKLAKVQRKLSHKVKGSNNRKKAKRKVAVVYEHTANQRRDFLHKLSHRLTHENQVKTIAVEDLNIKGMVRNRHLSKAITDASWSEFLRMLQYKCNWYGINFIKVNRFAPTSKTCSVCGHVNQELQLKDRTWTCIKCKTKHDRDVNASVNIKDLVRQELLDIKPAENSIRKLRSKKQEATPVRVWWFTIVQIMYAPKVFLLQNIASLIKPN